MNVGRAFALGLGAMRTVDTLKEACLERSEPLLLSSLLKSSVSTVLVTATAFYLGREEPLSERISTSLGASGIAAILHELQAYVGTASDLNKVTFMRAQSVKATR